MTNEIPDYDDLSPHDMLEQAVRAQRLAMFEEIQKRKTRSQIPDYDDGPRTLEDHDAVERELNRIYSSEEFNEVPATSTRRHPYPNALSRRVAAKRAME